MYSFIKVRHFFEIFILKNENFFQNNNGVKLLDLMVSSLFSIALKRLLFDFISLFLIVLRLYWLK